MLTLTYLTSRPDLLPNAFKRGRGRAKSGVAIFTKDLLGMFNLIDSYYK